MNSKEIILLSQPAEVSMADEWFDIASPDHFWMTWRFRVIGERLKKLNVLNPAKKYLEIGCGHGAFLQQSDESLNITTDGCDLNLFALKKATHAKGNVYVYDIYQNRPEMVNQYEGVFLLDVIEHVDDDASFVKAALNHAHKDGIVVINVPAMNLLFSRYDVVAGHKRRYSKRDLEALFEKCDVEPLSIGYWGLSLFPVAWIRKFYLKFVKDEAVIEKGFKPVNSFVNSMMKFLMKVDTTIFANPPFGTSLIAIGRKKS